MDSKIPIQHGLLYRGRVISCPSHYTQKREGDWFKKGDTLVEFGPHHTKWSQRHSTKLLAPFEGQVTLSGYPIEREWDARTLQPRYDRGAMDAVRYLFKIRPVKGQYYSGAMQDTYSEIINYVQEFINDPSKLERKYVFSHGFVKFLPLEEEISTQDYVERLRYNLNMLRNHQYVVQPVKPNDYVPPFEGPT